MASISRSQIALPNAQSSADFSTDRIASGLPGPLGTRMSRSLMMPFSIATSVARMRSCGMPKKRMAEPMIHWFVEETAQALDQFAHLRKNVGADNLGEIGVARLLHDFLPQPAVHLDHFSAHDLFGHLARFVVGVARARPTCNFSRHQSLFQFQFPRKESFSGISGPERAVAIKRGGERFQAKYTFDEFDLKRCETRHEVLGLGRN